MLARRNSFFMPSVFEDFFNDVNQVEKRNFTNPAFNLKETEKEFVIEAASPGMKKEDFKIDLQERVLTISAELEDNKEQKEGENYYRREFCYGSFCKSYQLPENVNEEKISASYENGILSITIPKAEEKEKISKMIKIK
ncbi:MAG: Hsp20/alpha crystallin family protein [Bacteroidales bacterium]|nr:Hsp20/alpha crystallin family protein [Bacteroidales bacterium]